MSVYYMAPEKLMHYQGTLVAPHTVSMNLSVSLNFSPKAAAMWAKFAMEKQGRMKGYGMDYSMKIVKEIYKSQVYCVKNKTFINFALKNRR